MTEHMRQARRLAATALIVVLAAIVGWIAMDSATARAATPEQDPICAEWKLRGATGAYPAVVFGDTPAGATVVDAKTVKLVKPASGVDPGVEFAAFDLDFEATTETIVAVKYELGDGAATSAGAVRFFGFEEQGANTVTGTTKWMELAVPDQGTLLHTMAAGEKLGTVGMVYDASNNTAGSVTFSEMTIGGRAVSFTECEEPTPSPTVTTPAATTPPATTGPTPTAPATPPVLGGPSLPVTGPTIWHAVGLGGILLGAGLLFVLVFRPRRKTTYRA